MFRECPFVLVEKVGLSSCNSCNHPNVSYPSWFLERRGRGVFLARRRESQSLGSDSRARSVRNAFCSSRVRSASRRDLSGASISARWESGRPVAGTLDETPRRVDAGHRFSRVSNVQQHGRVTLMYILYEIRMNATTRTCVRVRGTTCAYARTAGRETLRCRLYCRPVWEILSFDLRRFGRAHSFTPAGN